MALSVLNYFVFQVPEARVPLMIVDALVVWGLTILEKRLKEEKAAMLATESVQNESGKKETRALKAANVQQQKAEQKKQHIDQKVSHSAPRNPIMQPDKNKKTF